MTTRSLIQFNCKNCGHKYLCDISERGYIIQDVSIKGSKNYKRFWADRFDCPSCKCYTPPVVLVLETNSNDGIWKQLDSIKSNDESWQSSKKNSQMLILDDFRMLIKKK